MFHKNVKNLGAINLNSETQTKTMKFIEIYKNLEATGSVPHEQLYDNAIEMFNREMDQRLSENTSEKQSLVDSFKEAQEQSHKIDVSKIFKE